MRVRPDEPRPDEGRPGEEERRPKEEGGRPDEEEVEMLLDEGSLRIERIVSRGHASPPGFWYDQTEDEWVMLLAGAARLLLRDPDEEVTLAPGDHLWLPAHRPHRVEWTDPEHETVWIAVFSVTPGVRPPHRGRWPRSTS